MFYFQLNFYFAYRKPRVVKSPRLVVPKRAVSCLIMKRPRKIQDVCMSAGDVSVKPMQPPPTVNTFVERNIGDNKRMTLTTDDTIVERNIVDNQRDTLTTASSTRTLTAAEAYKMFAKKKQGSPTSSDDLKLPNDFNPRSLFTKSSKPVPPNSPNSETEK